MSTEMVTISQTIPQLDQLPDFIEQTQLDGTDGKNGYRHKVGRFCKLNK